MYVVTTPKANLSCNTITITFLFARVAQLLKNITWYTERSISEISLGGLLILVVIRTIQYNMMKMRDKYLHTNCLAALANMSGQFRSLHPYVAQRLVSLFETLAKKHARLEQQVRHPHELDAAASSAHTTAVTVVPSLDETTIDLLGGDGLPAEDMVGDWRC